MFYEVFEKNFLYSVGKFLSPLNLSGRLGCPQYRNCGIEIPTNTFLCVIVGIFYY